MTATTSHKNRSGSILKPCRLHRSVHCDLRVKEGFDRRQRLLHSNTNSYTHKGARPYVCCRFQLTLFTLSPFPTTRNSIFFIQILSSLVLFLRELMRSNTFTRRQWCPLQADLWPGRVHFSLSKISLGLVNFYRFSRNTQCFLETFSFFQWLFCLQLFVNKSRSLNVYLTIFNWSFWAPEFQMILNCWRKFYALTHAQHGRRWRGIVDASASCLDSENI